ncbi:MULTISPECIES: LysR family transcriptional regulator [Brucella]|uniref:LysR family transcriptional regulator n=1 Tax=Brucella TaxID=234 RepID=UPI00224B585F|nr:MULTISPECIES: LysR family transcriptional regulator [Brucella]
MKSLDIDALQAFVLAAEMKSFTRAAEALDTTQAAVSLKIRRIEDTLGRRLLDRTPRRVALSMDGEAFLPHARALLCKHEEAVSCFGSASRRLVVGISHHLVGSDLPLLLKRLSTAQPGIILELHLSSSRKTLEEFDNGALDAAIILQHGNGRRGGEIIHSEEFSWMASPEYKTGPKEPLRLATQPEPCSVRAMAIAALEQSRIPWQTVFVGGGVATIGAAVAAGVAVAAMVRRVAPLGTLDVTLPLGLPELPTRDVILYSNLADDTARTALRTLGAAIRTTSRSG